MVCTYSGEHRVNSCGKWLTSVENLKIFVHSKLHHLFELLPGNCSLHVESVDLKPKVFFIRLPGIFSRILGIVEYIL